jgi:gamma-glutamylcyclotransferase (GGCT)/AIG2-like uncharacterized protein YtfP
MKYAVYGTLRLNQGNYNWCLKDKKNVTHLETKRIKGYKMFNVGSFPGIKEDPNESIVVDIFEVNNEDVKVKLDQLEGYRSYNEESSMYLKRKTKEDEYIYIWNDKFNESRKIENGDWIER